MTTTILNTSITTRDIIDVMLGRKLRMVDIVNELEAKFGPCDRKLIRNRVDNMLASKNVDIETLEKQDFDARVKYWYLKEVRDCYFNKSALTRHLRRGLPAVVRVRKEREYPRPKFTPEEINVCRLAKAAHLLWSTGVWIPPKLVATGKKGDKITQQAGVNAAPRYSNNHHSDNRGSQWNTI